VTTLPKNVRLSPVIPIPSDWRVASCPFPMPCWQLCGRVQLSQEINFPITRITWPSRVERKNCHSVVQPCPSLPHSFFFPRPICLPFRSIPHPHMSPSGSHITIVLQVFFFFFFGGGTREGAMSLFANKLLPMTFMVILETSPLKKKNCGKIRDNLMN